MMLGDFLMIGSRVLNLTSIRKAVGIESSTGHNIGAVERIKAVDLVGRA